MSQRGLLKWLPGLYIISLPAVLLVPQASPLAILCEVLVAVLLAILLATALLRARQTEPEAPRLTRC